mgnify:CR=1 FL=1
MEQAQAGECHCNTVLIAGLNNIIITDRAACLCNILNAAAMRTLNVIAEREECVTAESNVLQLCNPSLFLFASQRFRFFSEEVFPYAVSQYILIIIGDVNVDGVVAVGAAYSVNEREVHYFRVLAQPPYIGLVSCEACAVDTALLTCSDTDGLSVLNVAHRVALGVFQGDEAYDEVAFSLFGECLVLCWDVLEECRVVEFHIVASLLECYSVHLFALYWFRYVQRIHLYDVVCTLAFAFQYLQSFWSIVRCNHTVAYLTFDESGCCYVASVAQCHEVAVRTHAVGAAGADVAVLEGVMGFYDGMAPGVADASSYQVARDTETPVVLVVNGRGASLSLAAVIRGIAEFLPCANVRGVVLNKTSAAACAYAAPAIEKHTGVAVLGNIPADEAFSLESRHLGLVTADEVEQLSARIDKMAELVEKSVDVDRLLEIAATAPDIREEPYRLEPIAGARPIVAVARDEAFLFYYEENLRALEDLGCELAFFSPLCDSELPRGTSALYLGGGYPELHARQLSENAPMREAVRRAVESGMPTVAECGGFLYLQREIADSEGRRWPVAGALEGASENGGRLSHFGYVELTSQRDGLYGPRGTRIRAHEFHYWQSTCPGGDFWAQKPRRDKGWPCMTTIPSLVAGFPHVYYPANPDVVRAFASAAASFAERRRHG